jgi:hypothetical protein
MGYAGPIGSRTNVASPCHGCLDRTGNHSPEELPTRRRKIRSKTANPLKLFSNASQSCPLRLPLGPFLDYKKTLED